jgi:hypothetical protein
MLRLELSTQLGMAASRAVAGPSAYFLMYIQGFTTDRAVVGIGGIETWCSIHNLTFGNNGRLQKILFANILIYHHLLSLRDSSELTPFILWNAA